MQNKLSQVKKPMLPRAASICELLGFNDAKQFTCSSSNIYLNIRLWESQKLTYCHINFREPKCSKIRTIIRRKQTKLSLSNTDCLFYILVIKEKCLISTSFKWITSPNLHNWDTRFYIQDKRKSQQSREKSVLQQSGWKSAQVYAEMYLFTKNLTTY